MYSSNSKWIDEFCFAKSVRQPYGQSDSSNNKMKFKATNVCEFNDPEIVFCFWLTFVSIVSDYFFSFIKPFSFFFTPYFLIGNKCSSCSSLIVLFLFSRMNQSHMFYFVVMHTLKNCKVRTLSHSLEMQERTERRLERCRCRCWTKCWRNFVSFLSLDTRTHTHTHIRGSVELNKNVYFWQSLKQIMTKVSRWYFKTFLLYRTIIVRLSLLIQMFALPKISTFWKIAWLLLYLYKTKKVLDWYCLKVQQ